MEKPTVVMSMRRGGARLITTGKAHSPLHVLLWQAGEVQQALRAAAAAQKTLYNDIAAWASSENRALSDVCSCTSELSALYTATQAQLALAYKSFRKEMSLVLEGEKRCDAAQMKLKEAEHKRLKLRRQVLRAQNRRQMNGENRRSGDFTALQTQLAEAERTAERAHMEACEASREQEAVKLVIVRGALTKLSESHLTMSSFCKTIFEACREVVSELPEPPPPGDPLSCIRYTGFEATRSTVDRVKTSVSLGLTVANAMSSSQLSSVPTATSTPVTSPNSSNWTPEPSAPSDVFCANADPPPPYNNSFFSGASPTGGGGHNRSGSSSAPRRHHYQNTSSISPVPSCSHSRNSSHCSSIVSPCANANGISTSPTRY